MVQAYWNIGRIIVEEEQRGKAKADYGEFLLQTLSQRLTKDFGKGFDYSNVKNMVIITMEALAKVLICHT